MYKIINGKKVQEFFQNINNKDSNNKCPMWVFIIIIILLLFTIYLCKKNKFI